MIIIDKYCNYDCEGLLKDLIDSLRIESIKDENTKGLPFGENIDFALRHALECANRMGFKTHYENGFYGYAEIGEGDELIGVLCHVDVVPAGNLDEWAYPPFQGCQIGDTLWGRGTIDDKGPLFAILYAMKRIKEEYPTLSKRIRLIIGADEESGCWECIRKYKEIEEIPQYGFCPDAEFPAIYGEKGIMQIELSATPRPLDYRVIGGEAPNVVPESCLLESPFGYDIASSLDKLNFNYERSLNEIIVKGKAAHASVNWEGVNAITRMCQALTLHTDNCLIKFISDQIGQDNYGMKIFGDCRDEESGNLTISVGLISVSNESCKAIFDIRIPVTKDLNKIKNNIQTAAAGYGLAVRVNMEQAPLYVPRSNPIIDALCKAYSDKDGESTEPIIIGGGTYAKAFKNFVAFGPLFPGEEDTAHCTNEKVTLESLLKSMEIYYKALKRLVSI